MADKLLALSSWLVARNIRHGLLVPRPSPLVVYALLAFALPSARAEELAVLNRIQARHEQVHSQVAPAVVALQSRTAKTGAGFYYGTGVVVSPDGLVLTSSTVVPEATRIVQVFFPDGRVMEAKVLALDTGTESCVLQVTHPQGEAPKPFPFVALSDSSKIAVGELAYTAGNPFHTISRDGQVAWSVGTISGSYTIASADEHSRYRGQVLETDAAVNPGSDGGPLLDSNGRLLGILSLCFCESRWLGTAIPVHLIHRAVAPLRDLPLHDPRSAPASPPGPNAVPVSYEANEAASAARAVPDALRHAARAAAGAMVKVIAKRAENGARDVGTSKQSLVRRLRQRPDAPVSGVIVDPAGYILTSAFNVAGDVAGIEVQFPGGKSVPAELLGRHFGLDVAVLKIEPGSAMAQAPGAPAAGTTAPPTLPFVPLAENPALQIGRFVAVLGSSEAGAPTHTSGIVSALARLDGCAVQTDALINYGNAGGPVVDLRGRLVGLAAHVQTQADWSQQNCGVGFFTQSDKIIAALPDLKAGRDIKAPPGSFLQPYMVEGPVEARGVKLEALQPGSVAAAAKLLVGDMITAVDGMDTHSWQALVRVLKAHKPGDMVEITYQRAGVSSRVQTVLALSKEASQK